MRRGGAAQSRVVLVAGMREGCRSRLANDRPRAPKQIVIRRLLAGELEQEIPVVVFGEQSEQHASGVHERRRVAVPPVFEQAAHGGDRSKSLEVLGSLRGKRQHRLVPRAFVALQKRQGQRWTVRQGQGCQGVACDPGESRHVHNRAIFDRRGGVFEQPGQREAYW